MIIRGPFEWQKLSQKAAPSGWFTYISVGLETLLVQREWLRSLFFNDFPRSRTRISEIFPSLVSFWPACLQTLCRVLLSSHYSQSPTYEWILVWVCVCKSNKVSLGYRANTISYVVLHCNRFIILFTQIIHKRQTHKNPFLIIWYGTLKSTVVPATSLLVLRFLLYIQA